MNDHQKLAIKGLEAMKGDDLYRAQAAFFRCSPAEMLRQYGQSGKTRAQIINEYIERDARVDAAIEWVKAAGASS